MDELAFSVSDKNISSLIETGFMIIPASFGGLLPAIMKEGSAFMSDSKRTKNRFAVDKTKDPSVGYVLRGGEKKPDGTRYDYKEYLHHIASGELERLLGEQGRSSGKYQSLISNMKKLNDHMFVMASQIALKLDQQIPDHGFLDKVWAGRPLNIIRFLHYHQVPGIKEAAQGHYDRDFMTFHFTENLPGLRLGEDLIERFDSKPGYILVFFGKKGAELCGSLREYYHGVIALEDGWRNSLVGFSHILT